MDPAVRGMCFSLSQGFTYNDDWPSLVKQRRWKEKEYAGRLVRTLDPQNALPFLNYIPSQTSIQKRHYNLAYTIMVHHNPQQLEALLDALAHPTVFIYIHIDYTAPESFKTITHKMVQNRTNIAIMPTSFAISWAHISLLWVEIRAFFDLLDLISFDYVINLSGSDYPIKSAITIYEHLQRRPGSNWIYWNDGGHLRQTDYRLDNMFHCADKTSKICKLDNTPREWRSWAALHELFPHRYKSSQWVILHRSAVEYMRSSEAGKLLFTWAEHTICPDEMILPTFFAASPFVNRTFKDPKRLMRWNRGMHPLEWSVEDKDSIWWWQKYFFWIRKVDVVAEPAMKEILDQVRWYDEKWDGAVAPFNGEIVPVDK